MSQHIQAAQIVIASLLATLLASCASAPPPTLVTARFETAAFSSSTRSTPTATTPCPEEFLDGRPPILNDRPSEEELTELCYIHFSVLYSGSKRGPLWSAYNLTDVMARGGDRITGRPSYYVETELPKDHRSRSTDYAKSGFDVGHMTPNNDMPTRDSQHQTFSMANMSPQIRELNQVSWRELEASLHALAKDAGELFVVTGPLFAAQPKRLKERVAVPKAFFKAVYSPASGRAIVFLFDNKDGAACELLSVAAFEALSGVRPFPALKAAARNAFGDWPLPDVCAAS